MINCLQDELIKVCDDDDDEASDDKGKICHDEDEASDDEDDYEGIVGRAAGAKFATLT